MCSTAQPCSSYSLEGKRLLELLGCGLLDAGGSAARDPLRRIPRRSGGGRGRVLFVGIGIGAAGDL